MGSTLYFPRVLGQTLQLYAEDSLIPPWPGPGLWSCPSLSSLGALRRTQSSPLPTSTAHLLQSAGQQQGSSFSLFPSTHRPQTLGQDYDLSLGPPQPDPGQQPFLRWLRLFTPLQRAPYLVFQNTVEEDWPTVEEGMTPSASPMLAVPYLQSAHLPQFLTLLNRAHPSAWEHCSPVSVSCDVFMDSCMASCTNEL